jgi:hypothetical protein
MQRRTKWIVGGVLSLSMVGTGTGFALPAVSADNDRQLSAPTRARAEAAALAATGGGTVLETEAGDDGAVHTVEIRLEDGRQVEVYLDANFSFTRQQPDEDGASGADGAKDN